MLSTWKEIIDSVLHHPNYFHVSGKRIARTVTYSTPLKSFTKDQDLTINMLGYAKRKIQILSNYYYHEESVRVALEQLNGRRNKGTYGSSGVTTFGHFAKKERPTHGPCIQSIVFTYVAPTVIHVDIFYRTTEIFKKFAADLIWLNQIMLPQFNLPPNGTLTFHFANATFHPQYFACLVPYLDNPVQHLKEVKAHDLALYRGILRWTWRYANHDPSLENFRQGQRVSNHFHRLTDPIIMKKLTAYINKSYTPKKHAENKTQVWDDTETE